MSARAGSINNTTPENTASCRIPEKLGFITEGRLHSRIELDGGWTDVISYCLTLQDYPESPAYEREVEAFDALGRELL